MNNELMQQLRYASVLLNKWLSDGPSVWNVSGDPYYDTSIQLGNKIMSSAELDDYCVQCKREGRYTIAVGGYTKSLAASYEKHRKLPITTIRGFIKVLICLNEFVFAFSIIGTALSDMQKNLNADSNEVRVFSGYYQDLIYLAKMIIDNNDNSQLFGWCANYSGSRNYKMQKTNSEIIEEFRNIRNQIRTVYGN